LRSVVEMLVVESCMVLNATPGNLAFFSLLPLLLLPFYKLLFMLFDCVDEKQETQL